MDAAAAASCRQAAPFSSRNRSFASVGKRPGLSRFEGNTDLGREDVVADRRTIDEFLAQRHLAVVGVSRDSKKFPNVVYRRLRQGGRTLYPVNSGAGGSPLEGDASYERLASVPDPVDGVMVMVPAESAADVVRQAVERGIPRVWLHRGAGKGSVSAEAIELCRANAVAVVDGACPLMFDEPVRGVHRIHRLLTGRRIAA
jgi:uncharacterized protein